MPAMSAWLAVPGGVRGLTTVAGYAVWWLDRFDWSNRIFRIYRLNWIHW